MNADKKTFYWWAGWIALLPVRFALGILTGYFVAILIVARLTFDPWAQFDFEITVDEVWKKMPIVNRKS